jgi:hypothetical protein
MFLLHRNQIKLVPERERSRRRRTQALTRVPSTAARPSPSPFAASPHCYNRLRTLFTLVVKWVAMLPTSSQSSPGNLAQVERWAVAVLLTNCSTRACRSEACACPLDNAISPVLGPASSRYMGGQAGSWPEAAADRPSGSRAACRASPMRGRASLEIVMLMGQRRPWSNSKVKRGL